MTEEKLTSADRRTIKLQLKISLMLGLLFLTVVLLFFIITWTAATVFDFKIKDGFITRGSYILGLFFLLFCFVWVSYFKFYVDLARGIKVCLTLNDYKIVTEKDKSFIISNTPKHDRIEIYQGYIPYIDTNRPLKIELAKQSNAILFISNGTDNYLDKPLKTI